ncbi:iron-containing alcohol dehydrogenase [Dongia sedimenti]|uniref:Iron-containing alcohol dehydrogenase n=1 Tax=Dongia sedimenti TaxID=3064282 RepID=A0ABU0YRH1_9PROT|nr:iron-containing alcohol dehydrogenase [Rhodospirillaceae bacterium R-7]
MDQAIDAFSVMRLPREILFGEGQLAAAGAVTARLGSKALVCTDARLAGTADFSALLRNLRSVGLAVEVFDAVEPDLPSANVYRCTDAARSFGPEVVIGIGGGSCIDLAKCAALILSHGGKLEDYYGEFKIPSRMLPVVAIPTTAGTGSEVTPVAVVSDSERTLKVGISSPYMIPAAAICDPVLTWTCPPKLTAIAGADALTHAIEAFTAFRRVPDGALAQQHVFVGKNGFSDVFALRAITLIGRSLEKACANGGDRQARADMMQGALAAGCAFGTAGTSLAHAVQYPIGALTHTAHGIGVAAILPYAMSYNRVPAMAEMAEVAVALGADPARHSTEELSHMAIREVARLFAAIGIPADLNALGLPEDKIAWTAESAIGIGRLIKNNPRPIDLDGMKHFLDAAYRGDLNAAAQ